MLSLMTISVLAIYLGISIAIVGWMVRYAVKNKKNAWVLGGVTALIAYNLVFWDWIPTIVVHKYYCNKYAGFWVYKTVGEWKKENSVTLNKFEKTSQISSSHERDMNNFISTEHISPRISYIFKHNGPLFINRWKFESQLIDSKTGEVLAKYIDFSTSQERRQAGWSGWKFWLDCKRCEITSHTDAGSIRQMTNEITQKDGAK